MYMISLRGKKHYSLQGKDKFLFTLIGNTFVKSEKVVSEMEKDYITDEQVVKRASAAVELEIKKLKGIYQ